MGCGDHRLANARGGRAEDALKEDDPGLGDLSELVEELDGACHRHLAVADCELTAVVDRTRRLLAILQGGLE